MAERLHRLHFGSAARGNETGEERDREEQRGRNYEADGIEGTQAVEHGADQADESETCAEADDDADVSKRSAQ